MKVRWNEGSIRFRITPTELRLLLTGEPVTIHLPLPGGTGWDVALQPESVKTDLVQLASGLLTVRLTTEDIIRLAIPEAEGVYFRTESGLRYFIEKDFPCVHPGAPEAQEASTETFVPPLGFKERHTACE